MIKSFLISVGEYPLDKAVQPIKESCCDEIIEKVIKEAADGHGGILEAIYKNNILEDMQKMAQKLGALNNNKVIQNETASAFSLGK